MDGRDGDAGGGGGTAACREGREAEGRSEAAKNGRDINTKDEGGLRWTMV